MTRSERHQVDAGSIEAKSEPEQSDEEGRGHDEPAVVKARCARSLNGEAIVHGSNLIASPRERWPLSDLIRRQSPISAMLAEHFRRRLGFHDYGIAARARLGDMRPRSAGTRPGLRRLILYGCPDDEDLLPTGLPGAACTFSQ